VSGDTDIADFGYITGHKRFLFMRNERNNF
jgi:hypothetical protein